MTTLSRGLQGVRKELGGVGLLALALLAVAVLFHFFALRPLEARNDLLQQRLEARARPGTASAGLPHTATKLAALYGVLETREETSALLARLHGIAAAAGVEMRVADYRLQPAAGRIERYEMTLPVTGSYAQIRKFLANALAGMPALSLDQVTFRKQRSDDAQVQAEMRLTFHLVRPL